MTKKVTFSGKPPARSEAPAIDKWVGVDSPPAAPEPTKRITIDLPVSLHRRVKLQCVEQDLSMAQLVRDFLEKRFPEN